jgi:hypothetical protein
MYYVAQTVNEFFAISTNGGDGDNGHSQKSDISIPARFTIMRECRYVNVVVDVTCRFRMKTTTDPNLGG